MKKILVPIISILLLISCNNSAKKKSENNRIELIPEPDEDERLKYEEIQKLKNSNCILENPDVSVCGIQLRNSESTISIIGNNDKIDQFNNYHYYSNFESETLTLTQHPGDGKFQVSIFKVEKSSKESLGYRQLKFDSFKSEKGIKLGMNKKQILQKLGNCYAPIDSTDGYIELYYRIESPEDTKTKLLEQNNMPIYYASYKLWKDKLEKYEFGFEYP
ncbi:MULTISPECIES: hypothetical protein [Flavobacterium]|uniref:Lipoprotein n=1 Tax=Flavobacterium salmonis TaxID=2654844 RepID=A0A6V6Z256_9FLAO|nr:MULTISPECIES: hypothetical protein [Flavobacterium]OOV19308.1 hypothetical protein BXU10_06460 [Flavobacterium sp. LM4]CAD0005514.1 hypothetical protein FLAT13_02803 [Flavobacterium salmonis]